MPEGALRDLSQALANAQARPLVRIQTPEIRDSEAAQKSWEGANFQLPREATMRANEALSWFEPLRIDAVSSRDRWIEICRSSQQMGMPLEFAVCRYLEWISALIDARVSELAGHSARRSVVEDYGIGADRALRVWQSWAANLHEATSKQFAAYAIPPERAKRLAANAERARKQQEIFSLK